MENLQLIELKYKYILYIYLLCYNMTGNTITVWIFYRHLSQLKKINILLLYLK